MSRRAIVNTPEFNRLWHDPSRTVAQIGEHFGVSRYAIDAAAKRFGYPERRRILTAGLSDDAFRALWLAPGQTVGLIAAQAGLSYNGTRRRAQRLGLPCRYDVNSKTPQKAHGLRVVPEPDRQPDDCPSPRLPDHPKFGPERDAALLKCPRSWREFNTLAERWNLSATLILQRWTQVRRAA